MFYRQGFFFWGGGKLIQASTPPPTGALPSSDPVPADRTIPNLRTQRLTVVVNV